jgi:hypothetical protein
MITTLRKNPRGNEQLVARYTRPFRRRPLASGLVVSCLLTLGCGVPSEGGAVDMNGEEASALRSAPIPRRVVKSVPVPADYDGDGKVDVAVWDNKLNDAGWWYIDFASNGFGCWDRVYSGSGDANVVPVPADYDGDKKADLAVRDNATGKWKIDYSSNGFGVSSLQKSIWDAEPSGYGSSGIPVPADYDGDGKADLAVKGNDGVWHIDYIGNGFGWDAEPAGYGGADAVPVPADYDGDGKADLSIKGSDGVWYIDYIGNGFGWDAAPAGYGGADAIPVPADYDGDGKADLSVKGSDGVWYVDYIGNGFGWDAAPAGYGASDAKPVPADYDGDKRADFAVTGSSGWYIDRLSTGFGWDWQQLEFACSSFGYSDLKLTGTMRLSGPSQVQIGVNNWGNLPAKGSNCAVKINGKSYACSLNQYYGGSAAGGSTTINPAEKGFLNVNGVTLQECTSYTIAIDANRALQSDYGQAGVFGNDSGTAKTQCLTWTSTITAARLGKQPDPLISGKTLADIVSSRVIARADNYECATCHNTANVGVADNLPKRYWPAVPYLGPYSPDPTAPLIGKTDVISGMTWQPPLGGLVTSNATWAREFIAVTNTTPPYGKPQYLKDLFQKWLDDGAY